MYSYEEAFNASLKYFNNDELAAKVYIDKYALRDNDNNILEKDPSETHLRIAKEFARIESKKFKNPISQEEIFAFFDKFERGSVQGSPMYGIGNPYQYVSIGNCFVIPSPLDSYPGIMYTDTQITQISCRRGGVGWDISNLRPKDTTVKNAAKTTSGSIEFLKRFSNTIREVGQHGRRGASLQSLSCYHPDILEFINVKKDLKNVTGSNISIKFDDKFMQSIKNNEEIELHWPVNSTNPKIRKKVKAKDIWDQFVHSAWQMAEPGCMFIDRVHEMSPGVPYGHVEISSNPCGEQYLPAFASCRLLLLNLYGYVKNKFKKNASFDYELFIKDVHFLQRMADNLVDLELECIDKILNKIKSDPEPEYIKKIAIDLWQNIKDTAIKDRRTGCGITGLADCLAALGIEYASKDAFSVIEKIQKIYAIESYRSSVRMAKELGPFPQFDPKLDIQSGFIKRIKEEDPDLFEEMQKYGRRNMVLLTIAPTGSLSCLTQTSSGLEPVFMLSYTRRKKGNPGDLGFKSDFIDQNGDNWMHFTVYHKPLKDWMEITGNSNIEESPYFNSTAAKINWINRVEIQAILQKWIDNSISTTINLPSDVTEELVSKIYMTAWESGCKGMTIYRDGCRSGVLIDTEKEKKNKDNFIKRPKELNCDIHHITVTKKLDKVRHFEYIVVVGLYENKAFEVFAFENGKIDKKITKGTLKKLSKGRYDLTLESGEVIENITKYTSEDEDIVTRLASLSLRNGIEIHWLVDQFTKAGGDNLYNFAKSIARALKKYIKDGSKAGSCQECTADLVYENGCAICKSCGWSKC